MIPQFPQFKNIELSDKEELDRYTERFPPYSDFDFASVWSWDVKEEIGISILNNNLVIRFTNYTTGAPLLSYLGTDDVNETARELIRHSPDGRLELVPEVSTIGLDPTIFSVEEDLDQFDYVCKVENHITYEGKDLKSHRKLLQQFRNEHPNFEGVSLNMATNEAREEVAGVYKRWDESRGFVTMSEAFAYERFLAGVHALNYTAVGIKVGGKLVAFHAASLPQGTCADALFSKADTNYRGVYATLDHVVAIDLLERGYTHMNIQQDLGIESLRKAKKSLHPAYFLKKYVVALRSS